MAEFDAQNNMVWPMPFAQPTMNRATGAAVSDASQVPWLIGIDGRSRGTLEPFPGVGELGWAPSSYQFSITITAFNLATAVSVAIGSVTLGPYDLSGTGSNSAAATQLASNINGAATVNTYVSASAVSDVVHITWATGFGFGAFTATPSGAGVSDTSTANKERYSATTGTTLDALFMKYLTLRLSSGELLRGYVIQKTNGDLIYMYKLGAGGIAFTDYITIATGTQLLKIGATNGGRVLYVTGAPTAAGGTAIAKVLTGGTATVGPIIKIYDMANTGAAAIGAPYMSGAITATTGALSEGYYIFAYRYYDSLRRRYSDLGTTVLSTGAYNDNDRHPISNNSNAGINTPDPFLPLTNTKGPWDYVEFFSSLSNGDTARRSGNLPLISRGLKALANDYWTWNTAYQYGTAGGDDYLTDASLAYSGTPWLPATDYVNTVIPTMEDIAFFGGTNFSIEPENELLNLRWSPLHRIEPENYPPLNSRRTNIPSRGSAHFCVAGDFLWLLGDGESYRIQKIGSQMSCFRMLEGISVVGARASVAVGGDIYAVTSQGLLQINAETGDYTQVSAVDRIILKRWSKTLHDSAPNDPGIMVAHDAHLGTVTVFNKNVGEAIILWLSTGRVSFMVDMWYEYIVTGRVPNDPSGGNVTTLMTEIADGRTYGGLLLNYNDHRSDSPNMMGVTAGSVTNLLWTLVQAPTSATYDIGADTTVLRFPSGNGGGGVLDRNDLDRYIGRAPLTGAVIYVYSANGVLQFKIVDSERIVVGPGDCHLDISVSGDQTAYIFPTITPAATTICSIAPVVMAMQGPPLSGFYAGDMLSRRHTSYFNLVISGGTSAIETSTDSLVEYYTGRMNDSGDEEIITAPTGDPILEPARSLPFSSSVPVVQAGTNASLDTSTPNAVFAEVLADGGLLYPGFRWIRSGEWISTPGMFVFGRVNPNMRVETV